jgi:NAD+ synthetase
MTYEITWEFFFLIGFSIAISLLTLFLLAMEKKPAGAPIFQFIKNDLKQMWKVHKHYRKFKTFRDMEDMREWMHVQRNFQAFDYLEKKTKAINKFFSDNSLDAVCVGLSGGIDSAVVLGLLTRAANEPGSPIKKIHAVIMPIKGKGTSNQDEATARAVGMIRHLPDTWIKNGQGYPVVHNVADLTLAYEAYSFVGNRMQFTGNYAPQIYATFTEKAARWAAGQLASIVRTPYIYYQAAIMQADGFKSIVVGTTNRDEGAYIGFFGKASDGMVDLQPIADLHKSEVVKIAHLVGVTKEIIDATPAGDVYDGKSDEEMIGAPYWFLEMYQMLKYMDEVEQYKKLNHRDKATFEKYAANIEELHKKNAHKYQVGSPAHYIDVMERKIKYERYGTH